jgi:transketolase C-terminal domain/subunit
MGTLAGACVEAADVLGSEGLAVGVCIVSSPLALDDEAMRAVTASPWVLVVEDHGWRSGLWASLAEWMALQGVSGRIVPHAVSEYQSSGAASDLFARLGLDAPGIARKAREVVRG